MNKEETHEGETCQDHYLHHEDHEHEHHHEHGDRQGHNHDDSKTVIFYIAGLVLYIIGMVLQYMGNGIANILFILTVILSGYHVTMEGVEDTIEKTKKKGKFQPNGAYFNDTCGSWSSVNWKCRRRSVINFNLRWSTLP